MNRIINDDRIGKNSKTITIEFGNNEDVKLVFDNVYTAIKHTAGVTGIKQHGSKLPDWVIKPTIYYITDDNNIVECYIGAVVDENTVTLTTIGASESDNVPTTLTEAISGVMKDGIKRFCWTVSAAMAYAGYSH